MSDGDKANILLVDDQRGKLLTYEALLKDIGENLLMASSASEALELLLRHEVAVILIDVCMPELDGFELAKMIREHPRFRRTAIIFVSAIHLAETDHLKGYEAGAVDYLPVPLVPELLRAKVRIFVELYRKTKQLEQLNAELERRVAERTAELELSNWRLLNSERGRTLSLAAGNMGSWEYHVLEDRWVCDEGLRRIFGLGRGDGLVGAVDGVLLDQPDWHDLRESFAALTTDNMTLQREVTIRRPDGLARICFVAAAASFDKIGRLERIDGVTADVTDRREAERVQELLAREVDHRARNALANVQAIMRLSKADTLQDYARKVERRVHALAHTHELLSNARWQGADIRHLANDEMAPYAAERASLRGPSVILSPEKAQTVALILHELATNAAKYGALSTPDGQVSILWSVDRNFLRLEWLETGGPAAVPPTKRGFGTQIIQASMNEAKGDAAEFIWDPKGLRCRITLHCDVSAAEEGAKKDVPAVAAPQKPVGHRVLVVEDEALVGMLTCEYLESLGYTCVGPFGDMDSARGALDLENINLAVLDVSLSGRPIYPLASLLRSKGVPFVFLTGFAGSSIDSDFSDVCVVTKPITPDALATAIARAGAHPSRGPTLRQIA
ncbi:MAG: response regulator [Alphaproteobacteria bacterium]|nr:response regulator [Alphaproteobacteria bacterium]